MERLPLQGELEQAEVWPLPVSPELGPPVWPLLVWEGLRERQPF